MQWRSHRGQIDLDRQEERRKFENEKRLLTTIKLFKETKLNLLINKVIKIK